MPELIEAMAEFLTELNELFGGFRHTQIEIDATDVARMSGHANYRITLDMYAGILDRARQANR